MQSRGTRLAIWAQAPLRQPEDVGIRAAVRFLTPSSCAEQTYPGQRSARRAEQPTSDTAESDGATSGSGLDPVPPATRADGGLQFVGALLYLAYKVSNGGDLCCPRGCLDRMERSTDGATKGLDRVVLRRAACDQCRIRVRQRRHVSPERGSEAGAPSETVEQPSTEERVGDVGAADGVRHGRLAHDLLHLRLATFRRFCAIQGPLVELGLVMLRVVRLEHPRAERSPVGRLGEAVRVDACVQKEVRIAIEVVARLQEDGLPGSRSLDDDLAFDPAEDVGVVERRLGLFRDRVPMSRPRPGCRRRGPRARASRVRVHEAIRG